MRERGILSFAIVIIFIAVDVSLLTSLQKTSEQISQTNFLLMQMEKSAYVRNEIERNSDFLIGKTMENELKNENYDPEAIREGVCAALFAYFMRTEETYPSNPSVKFYSAIATPAEYQQLISKEKSALQKFDVCANSKVLVVKSAGTYSAEFSYTGGLFADRALFAEIAFSNYSQAFVIPFGYTIKAGAQ